MLGGREKDFLGRILVFDGVKCRRRLALRSFVSGLIILRGRESLSNFSHSSGHSNCFHQIFLIWHHGLNIVQSASDVVEKARHVEDLVALGSL